MVSDPYTLDQKTMNNEDASPTQREDHFYDVPEIGAYNFESEPEVEVKREKREQRSYF